MNYFNSKNEPFVTTGFHWLAQEGLYYRLPKDKLNSFNEGISWLGTNTSGGILRFKTDSGSLSLRCQLAKVHHMPHMPSSGHSGLDFYLGSGCNKTFHAIAMPPEGTASFESRILDGAERKLREWTVYFPLYNGVNEVEIGIDEGAALLAPSPFTIEKPFVFYGSSITQGGCASRSGNSYVNMLSRWFDAPVLNFGFSGSAKGEPEMADILRELDASLLVIDYDHNAPSPEHLQDTHENFFKRIREKKPLLPIVLISLPNFEKNVEINTRRRAIIHNTYEKAIADNDKNVYFIDGESLFGSHSRELCTVDTVHPNDLGFYRMARRISSTIRQIIN